MDSTEPQEPSYYEVALTNRQVLIAFVALLICLLVAFLSGVWIGRGGAESAAAVAPVATEQAQVAEPPLEQLSFFNGAEPGKRTTSESRPATTAPVEAAPPTAAVPPPAAEAARPPDASDAMRRNLEATMAANRESPAMRLAEGERSGTDAGAPAAGAKPATDPKPAVKETGPAAPATAASTSSRPATAGNTFVQVYSSNNGQRAREIVAKLRSVGFAVVLAESPKGGGTNYRVRVGPYADRAAADAAAIRLRRDHRLDTWVTDSP